MESRKRLKNGSQKSSKKQKTSSSHIATPLKTYFKVVKYIPQLFIDRPQFQLSTSFKYRYARQSNHKLSLFFKTDASLHVRDFFRAIIHGNEREALEMLADNPGLLLERGHIENGITTDYSGRKYSGLTAFQIVLCAGDEVMAMKMKAIFVEKFSEIGQSELDNQFNEIFYHGFEAHLEAQQASADKFEREVIEPLIKVFNGIDPVTGIVNEHIIDDLNAALNKENNGSPLCKALDKFREAFTTLAQNEAIFNPNHLVKALEKYIANFDKWYGGENNENHWLQLDLFWRQVIGFMQRFLPANYGQAFCSRFRDVPHNAGLFERRLDLYNYNSGSNVNVFPLDEDPSSRLGFDFAIYTGVSTRGGAPGSLSVCVRCLEDLQKLCQTKTAVLSSYAAMIEAQRHPVKSLNPF